MNGEPVWGLFEVYGVEVEYMIVDRDTLAVRPVADEVLGGVYFPEARNHLADAPVGSHHDQRPTARHPVFARGPAVGRIGRALGVARADQFDERDSAPLDQPGQRGAGDSQHIFNRRA